MKKTDKRKDMIKKISIEIFDLIRNEWDDEEFQASEEELDYAVETPKRFGNFMYFKKYPIEENLGYKNVCPGYRKAWTEIYCTVKVLVTLSIYNYNIDAIKEFLDQK